MPRRGVRKESNIISVETQFIASLLQSNWHSIHYTCSIIFSRIPSQKKQQGSQNAAHGAILAALSVKIQCVRRRVYSRLMERCKNLLRASPLSIPLPSNAMSTSCFTRSWPPAYSVSKSVSCLRRSAALASLSASCCF